MARTFKVFQHFDLPNLTYIESADGKLFIQCETSALRGITGLAKNKRRRWMGRYKLVRVGPLRRCNDA